MVRDDYLLRQVRMLVALVARPARGHPPRRGGTFAALGGRMSPRRYPLARPLTWGVVLLCALAATPAAPDLVPAAWAQAAPVFEKPGLIELIRPTDIVADGGTPVDLRVVALAADGSPIVGMKAKIELKGAEGAYETTDLGGGIYGFTITPDRVESAGGVAITLKGKLVTKESVSRTWMFPVAPPRNHPVAAAASPATMTVGVDATASVGFTLSGGDPRDLARVKLVTAASVGTLANLTDLGSGQFSGLYTPPAGAGAHVALITAVDAADPGRTYGAVAIPLSAKLDQAVTAKAGASVVVKVGGRDFGPVPADTKGRAKVPVVVPPGVTSGTLVTVINGAATESPLPLSVPEGRRIALFPTAAGLPSDARVQVPVRAFVVTPDGKPDEGANVEFTASAGSFTAAKHEGGGIYVATYTPPAGNVATAVALGAKLAGASAVQVDSRKVPLVPTRPTGVALTAEPPVLPAGAPSLAVVARPTGPDGAALAGRTLAFTANGAKLAEVKDLKNGDYRATFTPTGKGPVEVTAAVGTPASGNPLAQVLVVPALSRLLPDGLSSTQITIATVDEFGHPVPNIPVDLRLVTGDGSIPPSVTTNANGVAQVYYTAGRKPGLVGLEAVYLDRVGGTSFYQAPAGISLPDLPIVASAPTAALIREIAASSSTIRVERQ
jgi:hypothetical protein